MKALITGITGQDGSYLAELLLKKGYEVHGINRRSSTDPFERIKHIKNQLHLHEADLIDAHSLQETIKQVQPDEVYNLAAQSHVATSAKQPHYTEEVNYHGFERLMHALFLHAPNARVYQASTSEMFGDAADPPQSEVTPFHPVSPYGIAKTKAHTMVIPYYRSKSMFVVGGILFNHESPRRGENFVTRKIAITAAEIKLGISKEIHLGNIDSIRDWGYAPEYVEAMWMMLQQDTQQDYVIGTGKGYTVRDFLEKAFSYCNLDYKEHLVMNDPDFKRSLEDPKAIPIKETKPFIADPTKANKELGWKAQTDIDFLVKIMVDAELKRLA